MIWANACMQTSFAKIMVLWVWFNGQIIGVATAGLPHLQHHLCIGFICHPDVECIVSSVLKQSILPVNNATG